MSTAMNQQQAFIFETSLEILLFITYRTKKTYVQDVLDNVVDGVQIRVVQRYLKSLESLGYIEGDRKCPQGFVPTIKAKQLFGAAA